MILLILSFEEKTTKSGEAKYLLVKGTNIQTQKEGEVRVFNNLESKWSLVEKNKFVEFKMKKDGKYWNVEDILPAPTPSPTPAPKQDSPLVAAAKAMGAVPIEPKPEPPQSKSTPLSDKMTPELWDAKEARTRKSIERQKSAELAVHLMIAGKIEKFTDMADTIYEWINK